MSALLIERSTRHGFADRTDHTAVDAVARTTAVQAQDPAAARLGVRSRATGLTDADLVRAIDVDRTLARTWLMRGTIHLVTAGDLRWLVRLIGPSIRRRYASRWRQLGLTEAVLEKSLTLLPEILADGARSVREIRVGLAERGVRIEHEDPQIHNHVTVHASTTGLICRAPDRGRTSTFVLTDDWLPGSPAGPDGDDALAELARRYFAAYSPATAADFATWSGLPSARAVELIRDELAPTDVDGRPGFRFGDVEPRRGVRLLPAFDNYLIGYRHRAALLDPSLHGEVYQGGWIRPVLVRDGAVLGTWALDRRAAKVVVSPFAELPAAVRRQIDREVADLGRFLDLDLSW